MPVDVIMPKLGESVTEGTIGRWLKQPGEPIQKFEPLLEVTTDKVDTEISSTIDGTVLELLVPEGETVQVGTLIARLARQNEANAAPTPPATNSMQPDRAKPIAASQISPAVARLAAEHGLDLARIKGTGAGGRVSKRDAEQFLADAASRSAEQPSPVSTQVLSSVPDVSEPAATPQDVVQSTVSAADLTPPTEDGDELIPLTPMRRAIAEHMVRSRIVAPHVTTVMEVDLSRVAAHRDRHSREFERQGARLTFTAYMVEAAVAALRSTPVVNSSFHENGIRIHPQINIGVAVALEDGLLVPVIQNADELSLLGLARAVNDLAERARTRRLQPDETRGGTFTITNHGVSGSLFATPIINQPQSAILGVGHIEKRAVVITEGGLDAIAIRLRAYLSLTFDHRVIDGGIADAFLTTLKGALENHAD